VQPSIESGTDSISPVDGARVESVRFGAPGGPVLEGRLAIPERASGGAVICHPHPRFSGSMSNALIPPIQRALVRAGWAALRFNFRGVGRSEGAYDRGRGELLDAHAALDLTARTVEGAPLAVVGWSFGALVGFAAAASDAHVVRYAGIAPPVSWSATGDLPIPTEDERRAFGKRALFVCGTNDPFCRAPGLRAWAAPIPGARVEVFDGQDHFFSTAVDELASEIARFITGAGDESEEPGDGPR
jgi:alpha/beta superfamily hydrolase